MENYKIESSVGPDYLKSPPTTAVARRVTIFSSQANGLFTES